jgi:hypothetical protein
MDEINITVEVPDEVRREAQREAAKGNGNVVDQVIDRLDWSWEKNPRNND